MCKWGSLRSISKIRSSLYGKYKGLDVGKERSRSTDIPKKTLCTHRKEQKIDVGGF